MISRPSLTTLVLLLVTSACSGEADSDAAVAAEESKESAQALCLPNAPTRACPAGQICPPGPPACGPGSEQYPHASVTVQQVPYNGWGDHYTLYEPSDPSPPAAPVIFYFHGWAGVDPLLYDSMLTHLTRKGYVVVFVMYGNAWAPASYEGNARVAVNAALAELSGPSLHVRPETVPGSSTPRIAFAGHSLGGVLSMRLAALAASAPAIPRPQVIALHDASTDIWANPLLFPFGPSTTSVLPLIPATTRLMIVRRQTVDANEYSTPSWSGTAQIPRAQKNLIVPQSDSFGNPDLVSDHFSPGETPLDAMDYWGYWRTTEGAFNQVFGRTTANAGYTPFCSTADISCDVVRNMGTWLNTTRPVARALNAAQVGL